jgi:hypothetical protein
LVAVTSTAFAVVLFFVALLALGWGVFTEFRQSRAHGAVARVPTLPFAAVQSALLVALGLVVLRPVRTLPWWAYPAAFFGQGALGVGAILVAGRGGRQRGASIVARVSRL